MQAAGVGEETAAETSKVYILAVKSHWKSPESGQAGGGPADSGQVFGRIALVFSLLLTVSAEAQVPVPTAEADKVYRVLDQGLGEGRLRCEILPVKPFLDFAFRWETGHIARCSVNQFEGKESRLVILLRVTPRDGPPVLLGEKFTIGATPPEMLAQENVKKLKGEVEMSGAFAIGEGRYLVEAVVVDNRGRTFRKRWKISAALHHGEQDVRVASEASTVAPLIYQPWDGKLDSGGVRLTVLVNAAPLSPRTPKLRAWDRKLLLESLSTLLHETPCQSVRLVAFNLDQARVVFEQDHFDRLGFLKLSQELQNLELGTVSYDALRRQTWTRLLARLVNRELTADPPANAVVFLGPRVHMFLKVPSEMIEAREGARDPQFFDFKYYPHWVRGADFPDSVGYLTKARGGMVYVVHDPGELARAIQRMLAQLKRE